MAISQLGRPFGFSITGIKKHILVMEQADLIICSKIGRENICAINPAAFQLAAQWFEHQERFWSVSFDRLEKLLARQPS